MLPVLLHVFTLVRDTAAALQPTTTTSTLSHSSAEQQGLHEVNLRRGRSPAAMQQQLTRQDAACRPCPVAANRTCALQDLQLMLVYYRSGLTSAAATAAASGAGGSGSSSGRDRGSEGVLGGSKGM